MKRILMLNYEFPPIGGGGGVASYKLAKGFVQLGHEVDVVTSWFKGLPKFEKKDGINIHRVKVIGRKELPTATMMSMFTYPFLAFSKCISLCKKRKYTLILSYFAVPTGILGYFLSKIFKIKHHLRIIGGDIYDPTKKFSPHRIFILRKLIKFLINNSDRVSAISTDTKKNAIKYYKTKKEIEVIAIPYESVKFRKISREKLGLDKKKKYVIHVGRLVKRKGFDYFIKVIAGLPEEYHGLIVGDGPDKDILKKMSKDLGVDHRIQFMGFVSEEKKFQLLDNSDVYALTSRHEGFGIVLQEAMQVGLPIVAFDNGGQVDFVKNGKNGYLIGKEDIKKNTDSIVKITKDLKIKDSFQRNSYYEMKRFGIYKICKKYIEGN